MCKAVGTANLQALRLEPISALKSNLNVSVAHHLEVLQVLMITMASSVLATEEGTRYAVIEDS